MSTNYTDIYNQLVSSRDIANQRSQRDYLDAIRADALRKGTYESGIFDRRMTEGLGEMQGQTAAANMASALDVARLGQQESQFGRTLGQQQNQFEQTRANQLSDINQAGRSDMMGNFLKLLLGGAGAGTGAGGNMMQWLSKLFGGSYGGGGAAQPAVGGGTGTYSPATNMDLTGGMDMNQAIQLLQGGYGVTPGNQQDPYSQQSLSMPVYSDGNYTGYETTGGGGQSVYDPYGMSSGIPQYLEGGYTPNLYPTNNGGYAGAVGGDMGQGMSDEEALRAFLGTGF